MTTDVSITFNRFDLEQYDIFLRCKKLPESRLEYDWQSDTYTLSTPERFASLIGMTATQPDLEPLSASRHLFDYQRWIIGRALDAERFAIWADTGLGKTAMFLEWARQVMWLTKGRVLILSPLQVIDQTVAEARRFYPDAGRIEWLNSREELIDWLQRPGQAVGITNYEKLIQGVIPELRHLAGLIADESSILKTGGGVIKWNLIKSAKGIRFKLSCTATPAPNDTMEYASQASFLEKLRTEADILWTYFTRDKRGDWRIKPHAQQAFYRFMSTWSIYLRNPAHFGFEDILSTLPDPEYHEYKVPITDQQRELMYGFLTRHGRGMLSDRLGVKERSRLSQLAKGFLYDRESGPEDVALVESNKPGAVCDLVCQEVRTGPVLVWTVFDAESRILSEKLEHMASGNFTVATLDGSMSHADRSAVLGRFKAGEVNVLISKAQLIGYGMNLQHVRSMVFSGFDDSFERMYQAVRRAYRFGQTETVRIHIPYVPELEGMIFDNVKSKETAFMKDVEIQERHYRKALQGIGETV